jgi:hypothetical protein
MGSQQLSSQLKGCETLPPRIRNEHAAGGEPRRNPNSARAPADGDHRKQIAAGRFAELNRFVDTTMRELIHSDLKVWMILFRDARNGVAQTAQTDLANRAGVCRRTVVRALRRLQDAGLLAVVRKGGLNRGVSSYRVFPSGGGEVTHQCRMEVGHGRVISGDKTVSHIPEGQKRAPRLTPRARCPGFSLSCWFDRKIE